ncbi:MULTISPECIES: UDP-3-O-(3-hydroxymyristoyl)glucosamine N-acyltransferase [unclassified Flavobacterium]|jgi:UDP-3-O-[3-hydroxymyristoyl] glucosamine N-acyltransferase|uniref:UDP-3-O-(3-hydroxymyristoyl)glucosamine N-acyltransferase n=1 Tax=unclassified Flavobacterium TaxID=196869 RepID=UPI000580739D|nr:MULTISPECIES: UDP-3-O-(3-hydroxymyristoyl)glucosamine N-acyltransferase [unclassified Flavobacterium]KIA99480.1 UDP-3-O-(3-hydroxymyristoyl) glucosamine N-acyltransferase [Flavobacterium sp. KMS]KIC01130.1 UDP-3-O-(3-hydroxymyristoyl) glucosamine N-acyltransferase [Flavobacterium sp. JRM]MEA9415657.1 UDP-3-O-(3-hydroxymyristoyl)glucosamine N-acyltransferase [Flavobacterium sp. PL02]OUL62661.1 UDP-3-O-(3-hydroxymyristoyl)glucosamine N-acyltransferase [Flavobacterium sp. AJR]
MKFTAEQIAEILGGEVVGNPNAEVSRLSKIEEGTEGSLTFLANPKYINHIYSTKASVTIVNDTFVPETEISTTLIKVDDAYASFSKLLEFYNQVKLNKNGIEPQSFLSESAKYGENLYLGSFSYVGQNVVLGNDVKIYPNSFIGDNVVIGNNVHIFAGAKIYSETIIGNNCTIHSGTIIGADGFGFVPNEEGIYSKVPQIGNVIIEDNVDIGANTTIDRATLGSTIIRKGVKLDNQIQIAHNVEIGENTVIAAQSGVAGSTKIGKNAMIGGQVGIAGHLTIGNNVRLQAQSGVARNIKDDEILQGTPSLGYTDFNKSYVHFKNLPKIVAELEELKKQILNQKNGNNG